MTGPSASGYDREHLPLKNLKQSVNTHNQDTFLDENAPRILVTDETSKRMAVFWEAVTSQMTGATTPPIYQMTWQKTAMFVVIIGY